MSSRKRTTEAFQCRRDVGFVSYAADLPAVRAINSAKQIGAALCRRDQFGVTRAVCNAPLLIDVQRRHEKTDRSCSNNNDAMAVPI
jgi:hypothetical protein